MNLPENEYPVVCYGEILWDILPDHAVPGGAPMNVAYHLNKLGIRPALITRVGLDNEGKKLILLMEKNGISTDYFQMDFERSTGKVIATTDGKEEVLYDILKPVAWDFINWDDPFSALVAGAGYFVYGSLSARSEESRNTLFLLLEEAKYKVLDINLRTPHYSRKTLEKLLHSADMLKINQAELELITGWFSGYKHERDRVKVLQDKFQLTDIVVTRGSHGSMLYMGGEFYEHPGFTIKLADTIGSGDAFLAGLLSRLSRGVGAQEALEFASALGALIASYVGPCPEYEPTEIEGLIRTGSIH
ncbi:MAG TPA: carbohydrate kinase [Puia sp.]|nr:carbohydrate kinase [Puia sp.]